MSIFNKHPSYNTHYIKGNVLHGGYVESAFVRKSFLRNEVLTRYKYHYLITDGNYDKRYMHPVGCARIGALQIFFTEKGVSFGERLLTYQEK